MCVPFGRPASRLQRPGRHNWVAMVELTFLYIKTLHCGNFVIPFCGNHVSSLGSPRTALHRLAGAQHLVSKHSCVVSLQEKMAARHRGELHALLRARKARAQRAIFLMMFVSDLQPATACDVLRRHSGAVPTMGCS